MDYPWQKVGPDLFQLQGDLYHLVVDYYSRFPDVVKLPSTTAPRVVMALKAIFAGMVSLRQSSATMAFSMTHMRWSHSHSPMCFTMLRVVLIIHRAMDKQSVQYNADSEATDDESRRFLLGPTDVPLNTTLLVWPNLSATSDGETSEVEFATGESAADSLVPYLARFRHQNDEFKKKQSQSYNCRHQARTLPPVPDNTEAWISWRCGDTLLSVLCY